jgi:CubicO group peptidase (beta-lactamase class C family)
MCVPLLACGMTAPVIAWAQSQDLSPVSPAAVDAYLRREIAARRLPGAAVAIVEGDRVVMARGYGKAAPGREVTAETQFYVGSCTKSFTALAAMQLVESGRLDLDAPVRRYLPWFRVASEAASEQITVRHLLNQTSGLSEAGDPRPNRRYSSLLESARALSAVRPTAPPGSTFQYYNQNYRLLGALIEQVGGQPYADYLRAHVLTPLAMSRTTTDPASAPDLAQGHAWVFGFALPRPQGFDAGALSSGYLISTAEDLAHYLVALLNEGRYAGRALARPATLDELFAIPPGVRGPRAAPPPGVAEILGAKPADVEWGYAMGWLTARTSRGRRLHFHAGSLERFRADMLLLPESRRGLALLVNENGVLTPLFEPDPLWLGLARQVAGMPEPPAPRPRWRVWLFIGVVAVDLGIGLLRILRLRRWKEKAARRSPRARWVRALLDASLPMAFLVGFPSLLGAMARADVTWMGFLDFIPDLAAWLAASATLSLVRGSLKLAILTRGRLS